jgi:hypothetical protein
MSNGESSRLNDAEVAAVMKDAAAAFVEAFFAKVPFYTGASRGQIADLAASVGVPFSGPTTGNSGLEGGKMQLNFNVEHFLINEVTDATKWGVPLQHPGPYNAIPAALAAAEEVMTAAAERLLAAAVDDVFRGVAYAR